jgi:endonuclease/exonuclease/phosphatase (EEP) superfamily protein YafD
MKITRNDFASRIAIATTWIYFTLLFGWFFLYTITGDRIGYLGIINSLALFFFLPLPLAAIIAAWTHRWGLITGTILGAVIFLWFWGPLFAPRLEPAQPGGGSHPGLTVMTYNVLGKHEHTSPMINVIQSSGADLVFIQELNHTMAGAVRDELSGEYPHQVLDPHDGAAGMGTISRYPLVSTSHRLPLNWIGVPQVITLDF